MAKHLVLVAGNIGAGKTSLAARLAQRLNWEVAYESVEDNLYLENFYADMKAWSFHLQMFFLGHRAAQQNRMYESPASAVIDRSIYEDAHIFARALFELGNMTQRDYKTYLQLYELVVQSLPRPDLLIYIRTTVPTLMSHIRTRGRAMEQSISPDYLTLLDRFYHEWMSSFDLCPVLTVPGDDLNFVHYPSHLEIIADRVVDKLAGKDAVEFPPPEEMNAC